jgi:hypothetical protein
MRLFATLILTLALALVGGGVAAAQPAGTGELIVIHEVEGFGPISVDVTDADGDEVIAALGVVDQLGDVRTTLPAGTSYRVALSSADGSERFLLTEPVELFAGNRMAVLARENGKDIEVTIYPSDPIQGGNVRIEHRTGRSETLEVNLRSGDFFDENVTMAPGATQDFTGLVNGRYGLDVAVVGADLGDGIDNLPVAAGQWTVVTVVMGGRGIELQVTGPGPLPAPSASPSPRPSQAAVRPPARIETGGGGTADAPVLPFAAAALTLLTVVAVAASVVGRGSEDRLGRG